MVLGVKWLETSGPIVWDLTNLSMRFEYRGKEAQLQELGVKELTVEGITKSLITAINKSK